LDAFRERAEIAYARKLVIGELDMEVLLQARQKLQRLQTVDAELLEKVVFSMQFFARYAKVVRGEAQNFVSGLLKTTHESLSCHISH